VIEASIIECVKFTTFWDVVPCSVADSYQHFSGACSLHCQVKRLSHYSTMKMEAGGSSKLLLYTLQSTQLHIPALVFMMFQLQTAAHSVKQCWISR